jgi:acyl-[acyl-carrier-protein]-phospholipid O-acyltransferase / long-chain-fatty-acid--[acyl-carrier-protein] ligase
VTSPDTPTLKPWKKSFWSLFITQCQGAFSDNVFKFVVIYTAFSQFESEADQDWFVSIVGVLFAVPFILFTMTGGYCAVRYSKRTMAMYIKMGEIVIMGLGAIGLYWGNIYFLLGVIALMSTQSAFFGPVKYGLIPELLEEKQLSWGNGYIGLGTFIAIILGTIAGGYLFDWFENQLLTGIILAFLAGLGYLTSRNIRKLPPADLEKPFRINFLGEFWDQLQYARKDRVLILSILGSTYFWFLGAMVQQAVMIYGKNELHLSFRHTSVLFAMMALGIGAGSFAAGYVSSRKIEYGLIPLGAVGISIFSFCLGQPELSAMRFGTFLGLLGFFGGFYIIPINALIQFRPDAKRRGSVIAMQGLLSWVGIVFSAAIYLLLKRIGLSTSEVFIFIGVVTMIGTVYVVWLLPDSLLRLLLVFVTHTIYKIKVRDRENLPNKGGLLLVCNHMSYVDALLLLASVDRPIRFIMAQDIYDIWYFKPGAKVMKVIPIPTTLRPKETVLSLRKAREQILAGEVVCIFAEGRISRTGELLEFRKGFERIMKDLQEPIVPVNLQGVWGSIFSFKKGRILTKWPEKVPYPVTVSFGNPMSPNSTPDEVREAVAGLATDNTAKA